MKRQLQKWMLRLTATLLLLTALLIICVLNPLLTYAGKTTHNVYTIFHNKPFDQALTVHLDEATALIKKSEFYKPALTFDICLNDGSKYPQLVEKILGHAFAWGFYNKVVLSGDANYGQNYIELNGYKWNLSQLLAHELTHCLQYNALGLWKSDPLGNIPAWKNEGYPEYIARQNQDQADLIKNITRLNESIEKDKDAWGINFADGTYAGKYYYTWWIQMQYCMDIKKMTYMEVLKDTADEENVRQEMMNWYKKNYY